MRELARFREPLFGHELELVMAPVGEVSIIEVQRKPSPFHIRRLMESIRKLGFLTPLVGIRRDGGVVVIDGQHRLLAARELGVREVPVLLVPDRFAFDLMELNVEKQMSLRERAYVALNVYRLYLRERGDMPEGDARLRDSVESASYVTLGMAYEKDPHLFGSAYESLLRRVDGFLHRPLREAVEVRERRAGLLLEVERTAREAVERARSVGVDHPFVHRQVISLASPIGRKRLVEESCEEVLTALKRNLERLRENPEQLRALTWEEEEAGERA